VLPLFITAVFVFLNGFFVAAEFALVKLRATQLERISKRTDPSARALVDIFHNLESYLSATQLGITLASLGLGWVGEPAIAHVLEYIALQVGVHPGHAMHSIAFVLGFTALTFAHIILGEQAPKLVAISQAEKLSLLVARPLRWFYWGTYPALMAINLGARVLLRLTGHGGLKDTEGSLSEEEVLGMMTQAYAKGRLSQQKRQLLERMVRFTEGTARSVMVPRLDVTWIDADSDVATAVARMRASGFTRYPLVEGSDLDKVVGYVHFKDVIHETEAPASLRAIMRELLVVPESKGLFELMREMQRTQRPMALVVDEYGGTSGVLTLEDVLEEIVGEIRDEHDKEHESPTVEVRGDGVVMAAGRVTLNDLEAKGVDLGELDAETLAGAVVERLGRLARAGDTVRFGEWEARVEQVRRRRVERVALKSRRLSNRPSAGGD
jgi:CBS domain containing-hemolysin-like protein